MKNLLVGYEHRNHTIYVDNYFTSYQLMVDLKERGF